ncbi:hypothetical protein ES703_21912 [subsurface metagenome]
MARVQQDHSGFELILANRLHIKELLADGEFTGWTKTFTVGETIIFGDACYFKAVDSRMWKADADQDTTMPCVGLSCGGYSAGNAGEFLLWGFMREDNWGYTVGADLWVVCAVPSPCPLTETAPAGAGDQRQNCGIAETADIIYFNPSFVLAQVA